MYLLEKTCGEAAGAYYLSPWTLSSGFPVGECPLTLRIVFIPLVKPLWKHLHRHTERSVFLSVFKIFRLPRYILHSE